MPQLNVEADTLNTYLSMKLDYYVLNIQISF